MINEIKLGEGIYFSDYRPKANTTACYDQFKTTKQYDEYKDVPTLLVLFEELQQKIQKLIFSNEEIKMEGGWDQDVVFVDAVLENYGVISKYKGQQIQILDKIRLKDPKNPLFLSYDGSVLEQEEAYYKSLQTQTQETIHQNNQEEGLYL